MEQQRKVICDFTTPPILRWQSVNDVVMGGVSDSLMQPAEEGFGIFSGYLSLENNGGFASVRTALPENDFSGSTGFFLRVRGDAHRYSFRLRTDLLFDGVVYKQDFDTIPGQWIDVELPFANFIPSFRGRPVPDAPPIDPSALYQIGLLISNKQEGAFRLDVEMIGIIGNPYNGHD